MQNVLNPIQKPVVRQFSPQPVNQSSASKNMLLAIITIAVVLSGVGVGYLLSGVSGDSAASLGSKESTIVVSKNEAGISDESLFSTTTDGVLEEGGIGDEGTHHLVRGVGPSQYAYLTSTSVNLDDFVGKKVQIWGDTISGKKAGWLIDVGKIKVIE